MYKQQIILLPMSLSNGMFPPSSATIVSSSVASPDLSVSNLQNIKRPASGRGTASMIVPTQRTMLLVPSSNTALSLCSGLLSTFFFCCCFSGRAFALGAHVSLRVKTLLKTNL